MGGTWRGVRARALVAGVVALVGTVVTVAPAQGQGDPPAPPPVITVSPAAGLEVGDVVTVTGSGFPPPGLATPVNVALCATSPVADLRPGFVWPAELEPHCAAPVWRYADEDGAFTIELPVTTARAPVVWAGVTAMSGPLTYDFHARVATAAVEVAPPAGEAVTVRVDRAERYADHGVVVRATYEGELPAEGSASMAECGADVLAAPTDLTVVATHCDGAGAVQVTPDAVGEAVAQLPASAGTGAVWAGGRSEASTLLAGAAPLTVHDPEVTITPDTGLADGQAVRVEVDELRIPLDPVWEWQVFQCERAILDRLPVAYPEHQHCGYRRMDVGDADADGSLDFELTVESEITVSPGSSGERQVDCAAAAEACVVMVTGHLVDESWQVGFAAPVSFAPEPPPVVVPRAGAVDESDAATTQGQVPVTLSAPSSSPVTVEYTTFDAPAIPWAATSGGDYVPTAGTLTFAPGETAASIPVEVVGDATPEPAEMALVALHTPTGATIGGYAGIGGLIVTDTD